MTTFLYKERRNEKTTGFAWEAVDNRTGEEPGAIFTCSLNDKITVKRVGLLSPDIPHLYNEHILSKKASYKLYSYSINIKGFQYCFPL